MVLQCLMINMISYLMQFYISLGQYNKNFRKIRINRILDYFRPPLCTYRLNWARRTSWGWWDDWDDTVLQTQDSKFEPWRSEAEHATSRSRRLPTVLTFTRGWEETFLFLSNRRDRESNPEPTTLGPPPYYNNNNWFTGWTFHQSVCMRCSFPGSIFMWCGKWMLTMARNISQIIFWVVFRGHLKR